MLLKQNKIERRIGDGESVFVIAEIGQNHQGDLQIARKLIDAAKECGADCVKFQKTDLKEKFNHAALERPYRSSNSFGRTYGEHKAFLEFSKEEYVELQQYADNVGIFFTASAMDEKSLQFLAEMRVPFIKIGSGDANNFLLIEKAAQIDIPLVISTGMQNFETVKKIYQIVSCYHKNFAILHCVSSYPIPVEEINLKILDLYHKTFPDVTIGYSGHELGIAVSIAAVALGSKIIERHITLDKNQKGSDHKCSLDIEEFRQMVDSIRTVEKAFGQPIKTVQPCEKPCYDKLGKSLVYAKTLAEGHAIAEGDLKIKVAEPKGIDGSKLFEIFGKILTRDVEEDTSVLKEDFQ